MQDVNKILCKKFKTNGPVSNVQKWLNQFVVICPFVFSTSSNKTQNQTHFVKDLSQTKKPEIGPQYQK